MPPPRALDDRVLEHAARARATWPDVQLDDAAFAAFVQARADGAPADDDALARLALVDLWLVCACLAGDAAALAHFDAIASDEAARARARLGWLPEEAEDVAQRLKAKLLVGDGGAPKLAEYAGKGALRAWLRVTFGRLLLNVATRDAREVPEEVPWFEALADGASAPETALLLASCRAELRASLEVAAAALDPREKALLRFAFRDRRTVEQIGAVYGVHGATASRWVTRAREKLVRGVRDDLRARLAVSETEAASLLRVALEHVETSLLHVLRTSPG